MGIKWEASGRYLGRIWKASQILEGISKAPDLFNSSTKNERPLEASGRSGTEHMGDILEGTHVYIGLRRCAFSGGGLLLAGLGMGPGCGTGRPTSWAKMIGKT